MKIPEHYEKYKFYSKEDACIEICHSTEYSYEDAVDFAESLGYKVIDGGQIMYDPMFGNWRGFVNVEVE